MLIIPAVRKLRWEDSEFEASPGYRASSSPACLPKKKKKISRKY
jgi:hypothetical protein